jgi:hypothetical protein
MKRLFSVKTLAVAAIALGTVGVASARTDVALSIGIPFGYVQPAPVYVQPRAVYVQPAPVYYAPGYVAYERGWAWRHRRHGPWGDADRDGVPNRLDAAPRNPYRY